MGSWLDYRHSLARKKIVLNHFPPALMIEPTNICNLKCPMCPSGNGSLSRNRGMMSLELFTQIIDQVYCKIGILMLWNQGESFLNPQFYNMLSYAQSKHLFTVISTNASLELDVSRLAKLGIGKLIVSMDGISEETYDRYRINGNYQKVLSNLKALAAEPSLKDSLVWQFIMMRHNEHEIPKVKALAAELGVKRVEFKTVQIYSEADLAFLPHNPKYSRYKLTGSGFELKTQILNRCRRLWTQPVINQDGEFSICCYDKDLSLPIGNLAQKSFEELWFSPRINRIREQILKDRRSIPICNNCGEGIVQRVKPKTTP